MLGDINNTTSHLTPSRHLPAVIPVAGDHLHNVGFHLELPTLILTSGDRGLLTGDTLVHPGGTLVAMDPSGTMDHRGGHGEVISVVVAEAEISILETDLLGDSKGTIREKENNICLLAVIKIKIFNFVKYISTVGIFY